VTEVKEVTQDRGALAGSIGWRASDSLTVKADALWSEYEIKENQFQAWYGNNINWQTGRTAMPASTTRRATRTRSSTVR